MKTQVQLITGILFAVMLFAMPVQAINWAGSGGNNLWSTPGNWADDNVPDNNTESAAFVGAANVAINVDTNFTIQYYADGYGGAGFTNTLYGAGDLTIDRGLNYYPCILNATGPDGGTLRLNCDLIITNSAGGATLVRNDNSSGNVTVFDSYCDLTINTTLQTSQGAGGSILFNNTFSSSLANLVIGSDNVVFGADHSSSSFGRDIVFNANSKLAVDGGTVLAAFRKFQVNGTDSELELNSENALNGPNVIVSGSSDFLIDINAAQDDIGYLKFYDGIVTLDLDAAVTNVVAFDDSSAQTWGTGGVVISNFMPNIIRFGTDANGLTSSQLASFSAYDVNGIEVSDLAIDSSGYLTGTVTPPAASPIGDIDLELINGGDDVTITWSSTGGDSYSVSNTADLVDGPWALVAAGLAGTGSSMVVTDAVDQVQSFYRVYAQ